MSDVPHTAVIHVAVFLHPVSPTGELGHIVPRQELQSSGVKNRILKVTGKTKEECIENIKEKLDAISSL